VNTESGLKEFQSPELSLKNYAKSQVYSKITDQLSAEKMDSPGKKQIT
jgi:hypothetical protein